MRSKINILERLFFAFTVLVVIVAILRMVWWTFCVPIPSWMLEAAAQKAEEKVVLTVAQWKKAMSNKAERVAKIKKLTARLNHCQGELKAGKASHREAILREKRYCAATVKAIKCPKCKVCKPEDKTGLYVVTGVCAALLVGGTLAGVGVGSATKSCP